MWNWMASTDHSVVEELLDNESRETPSHQEMPQPELAEEQSRRVVKQGYLMKLERRGHERVWKRRWVLLRQDYLLLFRQRPFLTGAGAATTRSLSCSPQRSSSPWSPRRTPSPQFTQTLTHEASDRLKAELSPPSSTGRHDFTHKRAISLNPRERSNPSSPTHKDRRLRRHARTQAETPFGSTFAAEDEFKYSPVLGIVTLHGSKIIDRPSGSNEPFAFGISESFGDVWFKAKTQDDHDEWVFELRVVTSVPKRTPHRHSVSSVPRSLMPLEESSLPNAVPERRSSLRPQWQIDEEQIFLQEKIADGEFGEVFKAQVWGTDVAVKKFKKVPLNESLLESLMKEVKIISNLRHPNVVLYIGACTTPPDVCIVTEWCAGGSLYDLLHRRHEPLPFADIVDIAQGIAQGMNYLHSLGRQIIHRDLKSHNVLLTSNKVPKVCDFGLSHVRESFGPSRTVIDSSEDHPIGQYGVFGTPEWMAPEIIEGDSYGSKVDVYSFGIVLTELLTRQMPFHDRYQINGFSDVVKAVLDDGAMPTIPEWCGVEMQVLIERCLARLPAERPSFMDIIADLRVINAHRSKFFFSIDIPRIIHLLCSVDLVTCVMAAKEIAQWGEAIEIPLNEMTVMVARVAALLRSSELPREDDHLWLAKAMLTLVQTADTQAKSAIREILRETGCLRTILRFINVRQHPTEIGSTCSHIVLLLIRGLPVKVQAHFVDVDFYSLAGGVGNGLDVLQVMVASELNLLGLQKAAIERDMESYSSLLRRVMVSCNIMATENAKRIEHSFARRAVVVKTVQRGLNAGVVVNGMDLTASRRLLPVFQDEHAFTVCRDIGEAPVEVPTSFVEYFGDHRPSYHDNALLFQRVGNGNVSADESDWESTDDSELRTSATWVPVFLFLFGTDLYVFDGTDQIAPDDCINLIYTSDIRGELKHVNIAPFAGQYHCVTIPGDGDVSEPFRFALRSRVSALRLAHRLNPRDHGAPPSADVIAEQRRIFRASAKRHRTRHALLKMQNDRSAATEVWLTSQKIASLVPMSPRRPPASFLTYFGELNQCLHGHAMRWDREEATWHPCFMFFTRKELRVYSTGSTADGLDLSQLDPEDPCRVISVSDGVSVTLDAVHTHLFCLGLVDVSSPFAPETIWFSFRNDTDQLMWAHELRPDVFPLPKRRFDDDPLLPEVHSRRVNNWRSSVDTLPQHIRQVDAPEGTSSSSDDLDLKSADGHERVDELVPPMPIQLPESFLLYFGTFHELVGENALRWMPDDVLDLSSTQTTPRSIAADEFMYEGGRWVVVMLLYFDKVVRVFESAEDEPDDPISLLYTTSSDGMPVDVRLGARRGRLHVVSVIEKDLTETNFAFRTRRQASRWARLINPSCFKSGRSINRVVEGNEEVLVP